MLSEAVYEDCGEADWLGGSGERNDTTVTHVSTRSQLDQLRLTSLLEKTSRSYQHLLEEPLSKVRPLVTASIKVSTFS